MDEITISAVAMECAHSKDVNLEKYRTFVAEAAASRVDYIVFPEVSVQGYLVSTGDRGSDASRAQLEYYQEEAEPIPGPTTVVLQELAEEHDMYIQAGMAERAGPGHSILYNSAVLVGPEGIVGVFRKFHNQFEWPYFRAGNELPVFPTPLGTVGMFICYDLCFPEVPRAFAVQGAHIASLTTAWPVAGQTVAGDYWGYTYDVLGKAAAIANQIWVVQSNQVGRPQKEGAATYYGHSRIINPRGEVLADTGDREGMAIASCCIRGAIRDVRNQDYFGGLDLIRDRRPGDYGMLSQDFQRTDYRPNE